MNYFDNFISFIGIFVLFFIAFLISDNKKKINLRVVIGGTIIQFIFAYLVLIWTPGRQFFQVLNNLVVKLLEFTTDGSKFVFNALAIPPGQEGSMGFFFAFQVLTTIIFFSSLMSVLYYLGVMQKIVLIFAKIMTRIMGVSGAESLSASANIFVGQTEAPLVIRPYVEKMTMSELMAVMTGGMATVAGGVMAAYVQMLQGYFPNIAGHLISASVLSAPASLVFAKIMIPEIGEPETAGDVKMHLEIDDANVIDAAAKGAGDGMTLALNVASMLLAFVALIAMINFGFNKISFLFYSKFHFIALNILFAVFVIISFICIKNKKSIFSNKLLLNILYGLVAFDVLSILIFSFFSKAGFSSDFLASIKCPYFIYFNLIVLIILLTNYKFNENLGFINNKYLLTILIIQIICIGFFYVKGPLSTSLSLERILGWIFYPFAVVMGVPLVDCSAISKLLGEKLILTEFIAYIDLANALAKGIIKDPRSVVIATYALCGFANFASIAIQIGGIGGIAPSRRHDLAKLGIKSVIAGTFAAFMTANIAGMFFTGETILKAKNNSQVKAKVQKELVQEKK